MTTFFEPKTIIENVKASMEQVNSVYEFVKQTQHSFMDKAINNNAEMVKGTMEWNRQFWGFAEDIYKKSLDSYLKSLEKITVSWEN